MSTLKKAGMGFGIFLGILGALLLFLKLLLPKRRGLEFYVPKVTKDFYIPKASRELYVPRIRDLRQFRNCGAEFDGNESPLKSNDSEL